VAYMVELVEEQQAVGWKVWDMKTLKSTDGNELPGEVAKEIPFEICLSNDGQYLAMVVYTLDRCAIWKIADWTKIKEFTAEFDYNRPSPISETVRFNPVQLIYPAGNDSFVIKTKEHAIWWEGGFISGQEKKVAIQHRPIACSPSGRYIAIRHPETINLYDLHDKGHILLSCPDTTINPHASFDSLERYFGFRVRQKAQAMVLTTKEIHSYPIEKFAREVFFPAGTNYFVALKSTFSLAIWDVESEVMQADFHVHQLIRKVLFFNDKYVLIKVEDKVMKLKFCQKPKQDVTRYLESWATKQKKGIFKKLHRYFLVYSNSSSAIKFSKGEESKNMKEIKVKDIQSCELLPPKESSDGSTFGFVLEAQGKKHVFHLDDKETYSLWTELLKSLGVSFKTA